MQRGITSLNGAPRAPVGLGPPRPTGPNGRAAPGHDPRSFPVQASHARLPQIRVLLCDDNPVYQLGLRALFARSGDIVVVGEPAGPTQAWEERIATRPDVLILSYRLCCESSDVVRRFDADGIGVVVLAETDDERDLLNSLRAGARGYLPRRAQALRLLDGVRAVFRQQTALDGVAADHLVHPRSVSHARHGEPDAGAVPLIQGLTARQREVARLVADGLSNAEVAARLYVSQATVKSHLTIILKRLHLRDRTQLAILVNRSASVDPLPAGWS